MPPWFDHWYRQQLFAVHHKLNDPEESRFWLDNQLKESGLPPIDPALWQQQIKATIVALPHKTATESLPEGWEVLSSSDQRKITEIFSGKSPLQQIQEGEALETLLSPFLSNKPLQGEKALWIWQYLLGHIGMAEENLMRHWVDAEEENLEAFEERYGLHEQVSRIPGTASVDTASVWQACYPDAPSQASHKSPGSRTRLLVVATIIISMIMTFSLVDWENHEEGEPVTLSESLSAQMLEADSPINLERNQLTYTGKARLKVEVKDSIRMLGGLVIFDPGVYLVKLKSDQEGSFLIESGYLKAFLGEEIFVLEEGMSLENSSGFWIKAWE